MPSFRLIFQAQLTFSTAPVSTSHSSNFLPSWYWAFVSPSLTDCFLSERKLKLDFCRLWDNYRRVVPSIEIGHLQPFHAFKAPLVSWNRGRKFNGRDCANGPMAYLLHLRIGTENERFSTKGPGVRGPVKHHHVDRWLPEFSRSPNRSSR